MAGTTQLENPNGVNGLAKSRAQWIAEFQNGDTVTINSGQVVRLVPGAAGDLLLGATTAAGLREIVGIMLDTVAPSTSASYTISTGVYTPFKPAQTGRVVVEGYFPSAFTDGAAIAVGDIVVGSSASPGYLMPWNAVSLTGQTIGFACTSAASASAAGINTVDVWVKKM